MTIKNLINYLDNNKPKHPWSPVYDKGYEDCTKNILAYIISEAIESDIKNNTD